MLGEKWLFKYNGKTGFLLEKWVKYLLLLEN
jgi:hypothetical protein